MFDIWNIIVMTFAITGALCWVCMILLTIFYLMCNPQRNKND